MTNQVDCRPVSILNEIVSVTCAELYNLLSVSLPVHPLLLVELHLRSCLVVISF